MYGFPKKCPSRSSPYDTRPTFFFENNEVLIYKWVNCLFQRLLIPPTAFIFLTNFAYGSELTGFLGSFFQALPEHFLFLRREDCALLVVFFNTIVSKFVVSLFRTKFVSNCFNQKFYTIKDLNPKRILPRSIFKDLNVMSNNIWKVNFKFRV